MAGVFFAGKIAEQFLQEKRQALLTQAVTKGLDPNANLKDSGVKVTVGLRKDGASWKKAEAAGKVVGVGAPVVGAVEGWYVPRYVIEGDAKRKLEAKAPDLKNIADLAKYASVFKDQEEPSKGRFYNCPAGWTCELDNSEMLKSYGLESSYTNFRPGTGPALDAAVLSSYKRGEPILIAVGHLQKLMFKILNMVLWVAPIGAFGAIAAVVGFFALAIFMPMWDMTKLASGGR